MLASLSLSNLFYQTPKTKAVAESTQSLLTKELKKWKASKNLVSASPNADNQNKNLFSFMSNCIKKIVETPETLPLILRFLHSSFDHSSIVSAISDSLGTNPINERLPNWAIYKTELEGYPASSKKQSRWTSLSVPFISSLLETFWSAVDDLDSSQRHSSIWEKYLILEILYRCLSLPFQLAKQLQIYFLTPMKVHLMVGIGSLFTLALARLYQTYQQRPDRLLYVEKCRPIHPSVLPQSEAWNQLYAKIQEEGARIFLTGKAGCGKTFLIESLLHKQQTDPNLQHLSFVQLNIADIATDQSFGYGEILEKIKRKLEPFQDSLVLVIDEAQRLEEYRLLETFRTKIMDPLPKMRCLFATTRAEFTPFKRTTFARRIEEIPVKEPSKEELTHILRCYIAKIYPDWPIPEELIQAVVTKALAESEDPVTEIGVAAQAIKLLKENMNAYEQVLQPGHKNPKLRDLERSLSQAETRLYQETLGGIKNEENQKTAAQLRRQVQEEITKNRGHQNAAKKLLKFYHQHRKARERSASLTRQILARPRDAARKELLLIDFLVLPELAKTIRELAQGTLALPKELVI